LSIIRWKWRNWVDKIINKHYDIEENTFLILLMMINDLEHEIVFFNIIRFVFETFLLTNVFLLLCYLLRKISIFRQIFSFVIIILNILINFQIFLMLNKF
jgi:hypothetical protein